MGNLMSRFFHYLLHIFSSNKKTKDFRVDSPLSPGGSAPSEVLIPRPPLMKKEWEAFKFQPQLTSQDLIGPGIPTEITYVDPTPEDLKYVLVALSSYEWKIARMNLDTKGVYTLKFNRPEADKDCIFKFIVNDHWVTSDAYKKCSDDGMGTWNNYL